MMSTAAKIDAIDPDLYDVVELDSAIIKHYSHECGRTQHSYSWLDIETFQFDCNIDFTSIFFDIPCLVRLVLLGQCHRPDFSITMIDAEGKEQTLSETQSSVCFSGHTERVQFKIKSAALSNVRLMFTPELKCSNNRHSGRSS